MSSTYYGNSQSWLLSVCFGYSMALARVGRTVLMVIEELQASGSIGRAPVSKTGGWGFESLLACHYNKSITLQLGEAVLYTHLKCANARVGYAAGSKCKECKECKSKRRLNWIMNAKTETQTSSLDGLKWLVVTAIIVAAVGGNIYYADQSLLYRVLALVALAVIAAFVAVQTEKGAAFWKLAKEARTEIRKVVWPTRQESTQTTMIVVAFVFVMALILWGLDTLLGWLVSLVIG